MIHDLHLKTERSRIRRSNLSPCLAAIGKLLAETIEFKFKLERDREIGAARLLRGMRQTKGGALLDS